METTTEPVVLCDVEGSVATITINRPKALNALNSDVLNGIKDAVKGLPKTVRGIIVTGAGDKAFVAGADIAEMVDYTHEQAEAFSRRGQVAFEALQEFHGCVIAAVDGFALGGGLEVALACDILIASPKSKLGLPESTLGVIPGFGGTQRLPRRVGPGMAKKLLFTGEMVGADDARRIGLVDMIADDPMEAAHAIMHKVLRNGPLAISAAKFLVNEGMDMDIEEAISREAAAFGKVFASQDQSEGMQAFLAKRPADFQGR